MRPRQEESPGRFPAIFFCFPVCLQPLPMTRRPQSPSLATPHSSSGACPLASANKALLRPELVSVLGWGGQDCGPMLCSRCLRKGLLSHSSPGGQVKGIKRNIFEEEKQKKGRLRRISGHASHLSRNTASRKSVSIKSFYVPKTQ